MAGGVPRRRGDGPLSHGFAVPALPKGEPRALRPVPAPHIYEGGGPRSGRGSPPAAAGKASSVTASPCQLSQRESQGRFAPFLPPTFMRGEGHAVAGGVLPPQRGRPSQSRLRRAGSPRGEAKEAAPRSCHLVNAGGKACGSAVPFNRGIFTPATWVTGPEWPKIGMTLHPAYTEVFL